MTRTTTSSATEAQEQNVVLMYPDNQLKSQVRDVEAGQTVYSVLRKTFFQQR